MFHCFVILLILVGGHTKAPVGKVEIGIAPQYFPPVLGALVIFAFFKQVHCLMHQIGKFCWLEDMERVAAGVGNNECAVGTHGNTCGLVNHAHALNCGNTPAAKNKQ